MQAAGRVDSAYFRTGFLLATLIYERDVQLEFSDLQRRVPLPRPDRPLARSPGHHVSGILYAIARRVGWLKPNEKDEAELPWRMAMGNMFEEFYFSLRLDCQWQPGEQQADGVWGNCDAICEDGDPVWGIKEPIVEETKFTECKVRTWEELSGVQAKGGKPVWMHQGKDYLHLYGPRYMRWTIGYYRGDWKGSGPVVRQYLVRFDDQEVRQSWQMTLNGRQWAEMESGAGR